MTAELKTVAIIGAGPVGLAAAAHALERNLKPIVLEAGSEIGHAVRQWGHVRMFSPWEYNIDRAAARLLEATGWNSPDPHHYPTGDEFVTHYLEPLAARTVLKDHHPNFEPRHRHQPCRLRQGQDQGSRAGASSKCVIRMVQARRRFVRMP